MNYTVTAGLRTKSSGNDNHEIFLKNVYKCTTLPHFKDKEVRLTGDGLFVGVNVSVNSYMSLCVSPTINGYPRCLQGVQ